MFGHDSREDAAAYVKVRAQAHEPWPRGGCEVIEDAVGHCLVEGALVAIGPDVELEVFQFQALALGNIVEYQARKIRLPGQGTKASKFRNFHMDQVVASRAGIVKGAQFVARFGRHAGLGKRS